MTRPAEWLARTAQGYGAVLRSENLRRSQIAWAGGITAELAFFVGLSVFVFEQEGTLGVGLVGLIRMVPAAVVAPFASLLGERYRRDRLVFGLFLAMSAAVAIAALVAFANPPTSLVFGLAALHAVASTLSRSAQWALLPSISRTPDELIAANSSTITTESLGTLAGPALGGLVLTASGPGTMFGVCAALYLLSSVSLARIRLEEVPRRAPKARGMARELVSGFPALFRTLDLSLVVALFFSQGVVRGALNVFLAVAAFDLLGAGESGVGFLTAALGVGGIAGAFFALSLTGRHLAAPFAAGLVLWGLPIVGIGGVPHFSAALVFLAVVGAGNSVADVAGFTLMQRLIPDELLQRALGVFWGLAMLSIGIGSIAVAGLISAVGIRWSLVATGAFLTLLTVLSSRRLATLDRSVAAPTDRLELLERVPMFAPLSLAAKDRLASALVPLSVPAGVDIIREGEPGDRFYMLVEGEADVFKDGEKTTARTSGDYFGEIALLRDVPRTATVRARSRLRLYALDRDPFLAAVTGHAAGRDAGEAVVEERLAALPTS